MLSDKHIIITIDGPVGAGKSSVARAVAKALGILYLDTGAMYRAFALYTLQMQVDARSEPSVTALLPNVQVDVVLGEDGQRTILNGVDVSTWIRTEQVSMAASAVSRYQAVRDQMVSWQRALACRMSMVVDGRDIGTVVLPDADLKVFLTAEPEIRARRRYDELLAKGVQADYDAVLADLKQRDHQDMTRPVSPLRPALDSRTLDSSHLDFSQVVETITQWVKELRHE